MVRVQIFVYDKLPVLYRLCSMSSNGVLRCKAVAYALCDLKGLDLAQSVEFEEIDCTGMPAMHDVKRYKQLVMGMEQDARVSKYQTM